MMILDIEFGKIKAKFGGSNAGHNAIPQYDSISLIKRRFIQEFVLV